METGRIFNAAEKGNSKYCFISIAILQTWNANMEELSELVQCSLVRLTVQPSYLILHLILLGKKAFFFLPLLCLKSLIIIQVYARN